MKLAFAYGLVVGVGTLIGGWIESDRWVWSVFVTGAVIGSVIGLLFSLFAKSIGPKADRGQP